MYLPQRYVLTTGLITLTASQRKTVPIAIETTYDFIWLVGMYQSDDATSMSGTSTTFGNCLINVLPAAGQEKVFSDQVPIALAFGTPGIGPGPIRAPFPARFVAGGVVNLDLTNLNAGASLNLRIAFDGVRLLPGGPWPVPGLPPIALPA